MNLKTRFRIALAVSGMTAKEWAAEHGVQYVTLYKLLKGHTTSVRLSREIEAFIEEQFETLKTALQAA